MNKIFKYSLALVTLALAFTACSDKDDDNYQNGDWNAAGNYANLYFAETSSSIELDPADPTTVTIKVNRRNTSGALSVNFDISENTDNIFTVGTANFADGADEADIVVNFPDAQVGKTYKLTLSTSDPNYVSYYSADTRFKLDVTRVKWNDVGFYYDEEGNKVTGWAMYTDDFLTTFYGVSNVSFPTRIQERDDAKGYFRLINTYHELYPYNDPGDWDTQNDYYIYIDATDPEAVYIPHYCHSGMVWSYGEFLFSSMAGYYLAKEDPETAADYFGKYENGKITFPAEALLLAMSDYNEGSFYQSNVNGAFKLVIDPDKDLYEASVVKDFDWEKVFDGAFDSGQLGTNGEASLYKGIANTTKDECDKRFAEAYGTPYRIESPYAEGSDIYFCVRDGKILIPEEIALQKTGLNAAGADVYMKISANTSSFTERLITLAATFQNEDGSLVYGSAEEVLSNITYTKIGTGTWTFSDMLDEGSVPVEGYILSKRDDKEDVYCVENFGAGFLTDEGMPFIFTWDRASNQCIIDENYTGYIDDSYGPLYVSDLPTYAPNNFSREDTPSYFDPETNTFKFALVYYVGAGYFGYGYETFQVTLDASSKVLAKRKGYSIPKFGKPKQTIKRQERFVGKKTSVKTLKAPFSMPLAPLAK